MSVCPGLTLDEVDARLVQAIAARGRASVHTLLAGMLPDSMAAAVLAALTLAGDRPGAAVTREERRRLSHALVEWELPVTGSRGYNYAEATAGGVTLNEIQARTLESRVRAGLFLVGEMVDVDGRLGGFNFQWAWASAMTAARALCSP